ncbi:hypothetical protein KR032_001267, partial [Drosophila birchii]
SESGLTHFICRAARPDTVGALVANRQGLCLVGESSFEDYSNGNTNIKEIIFPPAKGDIDPNVSGIGMAIAQQVAKLEPNSNVPATICLYSGNKRCVIKNDGKITAVIFKQLTAGTANATTG